MNKYTWLIAIALFAGNANAETSVGNENLACAVEWNLFGAGSGKLKDSEVSLENPGLLMKTVGTSTFFKGTMKFTPKQNAYGFLPVTVNANMIVSKMTATDLTTVGTISVLVNGHSIASVSEMSKIGGTWFNMKIELPGKYKNKWTRVMSVACGINE